MPWGSSLWDDPAIDLTWGTVYWLMYIHVFYVCFFQKTTCTERDGWCIAEYQEKCRAILVRYVTEMLNPKAGELQQLTKSKKSKYF